MDTRIEKLSALLLDYSVALKPGEKILLSYDGDDCRPMIKQMIRDVYKRGGVPFVEIRDTAMVREQAMHCSKAQLELMRDVQLKQMKEMDAFVSFRANPNKGELSDVPQEKQNLWDSTLLPVQNERVNNTKWVVLRYPNNSMAQASNMSLDGFTDFYFNVCTLDYAKMSRAMDPLVELMNKTDKVRILGPDTDLSFSIKGLPGVKCAGDKNIPDGEVYSCPVRDSMNGHIHYNATSLRAGFTFADVRFEVRNGKIVEATANDTKRINELLDTDEGARYFGEFSFGLNPYVLKPMNDTLFDEKIAGSFHLTPGQAYDDCDNGNRSAVHWDLVNIQRPEYGGGEIWFDGVLVRKDGLFVLPELQCLNPDALK